MDAVEIVGTLVIGFTAGLTAGLLGVGGGVLFVPGLVLFLDEGQLDAEATSLVAVVLVAAVGAWRQEGYGNVRVRDALLIGVLSPLGALAGVVIANGVPERALELAFAALQVVFAVQLARREVLSPSRATR
jgi:uncharacterized protein